MRPNFLLIMIFVFSMYSELCAFDQNPPTGGPPKKGSSLTFPTGA
ncbi:MAG: hypothetical protein WC707_01580 [Candidatus Babeliaceae bacterium]|jgi:hypothetical protein